MRFRSAKYVSFLFSLVALALSTGCGSVERNFSVKLIFPIGYTGMVKIIFTDREETQPIKNGEQVFRLNKSGTFITGGRNPFLRLGIITAQYADGTLIQSSGQIFAEGGSPGPFDKLFRIVGGTNDGSEFWAVVGTYAEEEKARLTLHDLESRR